jgi:effector-binding domain-containing protein
MFEGPVLDPIQILDVPAQHAAVIRLTIPRVDIQRHMGPAMMEVMQTVHRLGLTPTGPMFSYHFTFAPETFDFEVGIPVAAPITPTGRVIASIRPACRIARTIYRGPFEGLGPAWGEFNRLVKEQGHAYGDRMWESYLKGPEVSPDPTLWETELNRPIA